MRDCFVVFIANNTAVVSGFCEAVLFERVLASGVSSQFDRSKGFDRRVSGDKK